MTALQSTLPVILLDRMTKKKLSHAAVAKAGGVGKSTVTRVLTGERPASIAHLQAFAVALQTTPSALLRATEKSLE